ncbi:MAG: YegS/Rv2252/BmrU family lipid kinase [Candidatus Eremiobacteraeota bacterium]|nr:YegS/Rv2252/BmrU family lipid kinase [Candidatus Eremiobacteraeota bacterium]MBV8498958.1 YegS/Rv2252/BmrU family lipid kinase [Candidatus Eremiobacteraeota bacterium]
MRVLLVVNPHARRGRVLGDDVRRRLALHGVETVETASSPQGLDAIVVAGGDGTFARAIGRGLTLGLPMGLVPLGTFNDLARTLDIPADIDGACATIAQRRTRAIDVARVNSAYYVSEASIGVSSRLTRLQKTRDKQRFGLLAVLASALAAVKYLQPFHAEVAYEDARVNLRTVQLTIANSNHFGGVITVEGAAVDDGWLDLYSVEIDGPRSVLALMSAVLAGRPRAAQNVRTIRSAAFSVSTRRPRAIVADGEPAGKTPARFELIRGALRVFAPDGAPSD